MKKNSHILFAQGATIILGLLLMSGCLKTRSEVSPTEQSYIYRKKQMEDAKSLNGSTPTSTTAGSVDTGSAAVDSDELVRTLNGRIEVLENQVSQFQKEKENSLEASKIAALQESLAKMELQIQKLEAEKAGVATQAAATPAKSSDENLNIKKTTFDVAEDLFSKKEWKKAILSYQKFIEESPKSKQVSDAKYKTGVAFQEMGLKDEALAFYEEVIVQYPNTTAGKKAKIRSAQLSPKAPTKTKKK